MKLADLTLPIAYADARGYALVFTPQLAARIAAYHMGLGMTPDQVSSYYNAMQAFQTALGRQV